MFEEDLKTSPSEHRRFLNRSVAIRLTTCRLGDEIEDRVVRFASLLRERDEDVRPGGVTVV